MARDECVRCRLTVCFEAPFWIGLFERASDGFYEVCKVSFGAEPMDAEVWQFLLANAYRLPFSPPVAGELATVMPVNPKRMQREARRQMRLAAVGTWAQQALQWQREQAAEERKGRRKAHDAAEAERRFALRQEKRREKRKGH